MKLAFVGLLLAVLQPAAIEPPSDFALRIDFGKCWNESVDTGAGTFTRTVEPGVLRTASIVLTGERRRRLYAIVVEADLFGYPNVFKPTGESSVEELPPSDFTIAIQSDGRQHDIEWVDRSSLSPDATRLRTMLRAVRALLVELPSVQQLPQSRIFCL